MLIERLRLADWLRLCEAERNLLIDSCRLALLLMLRLRDCDWLAAIDFFDHDIDLLADMLPLRDTLCDLLDDIE